MHLKLVSLFLVPTVFILLITGCGGSSQPTSDLEATVAPEVTKETEATSEATAEPTSEATSEPTPEATPEPTPEATSEATPEPTPEATPEATPEPTPEATPEATPEPTPEATPEPEATAVSTVVQATETSPGTETCLTTVPVSEDSSTQDATVKVLVSQIEGLADPPISVNYRERARAIAKRARHAVVQISVGESFGGTGSLISADGYIVTNAHVVSNASSVVVVTFDGRKYQGSVIATVALLDPDLALVKIDGDGLPFLPLAQEVSIGSVVVYVGHPLGAYWTSIGGKIVGTTEMMIPHENGFSGLREEIVEGVLWYYWTEVGYTNPTIAGSSGSALLNCDGEIVGIVYGGGIVVPEHKRLSAIFQNDVIWDADDYQSLLVRDNRAVGIDSLLAFLSTYAEGLVESNYKSRESAVTRLVDFVEPSFADNLCRFCIIENMPERVSFIYENSLERQIDFLEELIEPEKSRTISVQDRTKVLPVGKMIQPAVVKLSRNSGSHTGTGAFITSDGYIITNAHVVGDATVVDVKLFDGREYLAEVIGNTYPENQPDLALLKIEAKNLPWIELADEVNIGDTIVGVGNPLDFEWVIWGGQITHIDPDLLEAEIQVEKSFQDNAVPVGSGSSGSPIVNLDGKIIGVKNSSATDFTIPSETLSLRGEWLRPVVIWDRNTLDTIGYMIPMGIHVDMVRKFVNTHVPGLLD